MVAGALFLAALLAGGAAAQERGYRLAGDQVLVDRPEHWRRWASRPGTVEFTPDGSVRVRRWRKHINAGGGDIAEFLRLNPPASLAGKKPEEITLRDAVQAGANPEEAVRVLDGDLDTWWEPEPLEAGADLASRWWLAVDLGRFVFAEKIVLRFAAAGQGDPFLLFDVLFSDGTRPARVRGAANPEYRSALRTLQPNKNQRVFEIDLTGQDPVVRGEGLRFVQVVVTGSDLERGAEVSRAEHQALGPADRGAVEYYKRLAEEREVAVRQAVYEQLDPARQGRVRYFRRERPRLAELEVWTEGDELLIGTVQRGGSAALPGGEDVNLRSFFDGDLVTDSNLIIGKVVQVAEPERSLIFDLGSTFWVDTQRLAYGRGLYRGSLADYRLDFSDGALAADGSLKWTRAVDRRQSQQNGVRFDANRFAPLPARFFRLQYTLGSAGHQTANLAEIQLYGEGYQPRVELESDLIRLGGSRNLLTLSWEADAPPGTQVLIQTRAGDDLQEELHYFKKDGTEVSEAEYKKLLSLFRGEITAREVPGSGWSEWSEPYADPAGSRITSPWPREFLKIRATLLSADPGAGAALRRLGLRFADPVARSLVGELAPARVEELGAPREFSLYIRPGFASGDPGFDQLLLKAPPDMRLELVGLYGGRAGLLAGVEGVEVAPSGPDSLRLVFPRIGPAGGVELLRLDFRTALFSTGAVLEAALQNSAGGEGQWQRVDPGDAFAGVPGSSLTLVGVTGRKELIADLRVRPALFTPNGDGINDEVAFEFSVTLVGDSSPAEVEIRDLSGRLVRRIAAARETGAGRRLLRWDGRDEGGGRAPPGIYCARVRVATDTRGAGVSRNERARLVALSY